MITDQDFQNLKNAFEEFLTEYRRNRFSALEIQNKDIQFKGKIGLVVDPAGQQNHISDPTDAGATYSQAQVQSIVDAVKSILVVLETFGLNKTS